MEMSNRNIFLTGLVLSTITFTLSLLGLLTGMSTDGLMIPIMVGTNMMVVGIGFELFARVSHEKEGKKEHGEGNPEGIKAG